MVLEKLEEERFLKSRENLFVLNIVERLNKMRMEG